MDMRHLEPPRLPDDPNEMGRLPSGSGVLLLVTLAVGLLTVAVALYPYDFQARGADRWLAILPAEPLALLGNVFLFMPLGLFEGWLAGLVLVHLTRRRRSNWVILLVALDAALLGLMCESAQLWLPDRHSSLLDLVANTLGGTTGGLIADWFIPLRHDDA